MSECDMYKDPQGRLMSSTSFISSDNNVHVICSYRIDQPNNIKTEVYALRNELFIKYNRTYNRSAKSWIREWKAHNLLYMMHISRNRTMDVDLNEDESKFKLCVYAMLSVVYDFIFLFK